MIAESLPAPWLVAFVPAGLLAARRRGRWVLALQWPLFLLFYVPFAFMLPHYLMVPAPALLLTVLLGLWALRYATPRSPAARTLPLLLVLAAVLPVLPETVRAFGGPRPNLRVDPTLVAVNAALSRLDHVPAVVLFRFRPGEMRDPLQAVHEEPVYTTDALTPDDSPIVRAHDRGPDNVRLFRYYAGLGQNRYVYLFDRADNSLHPLGWVKDLARRPHE